LTGIHRYESSVQLLGQSATVATSDRKFADIAERIDSAGLRFPIEREQLLGSFRFV